MRWMASRKCWTCSRVHLQADVDETEHVIAELLAVKQGYILAHIALLVEAPQAGMDGGRRQVEAPRQFGVSDTAIELQFVQDGEIGFVQGFHVNKDNAIEGKCQQMFQTRTKVIIFIRYYRGIDEFF